MVMDSVPCAAQRQHKDSCDTSVTGSELLASASCSSLPSSASSSSSSGRGAVAANLDAASDEVDYSSVKQAPDDDEVDGETSRLLQNGGSTTIQVPGVPVHASTPKMPRSFSVVPVEDLKNSPNSNLVHVKRRLKTYSKAYSDSDCDETETLLKSIVDDSSEEARSPPMTSIPNRRTSLENISSNTQDINRIQSTRPERLSNKQEPSSECSSCKQPLSPGSDQELIPAVQSRIRIKEPLPRIAPPIESQEPAKEIKTPHALMAPFRGFSNDPSESSPKTSDPQLFPLTDRKLSLAATRFPRVELNRQSNIPMHYMTVNPAAGNLIFSPNSAQYFTIQPTRSRGYPNQAVLDTSSKFITTHCNGVSTIDFGSTDGRNIKLLRRQVLSSDSLHMLANGVPPDGQCTVTSTASAHPKDAAMCQLEVHSPICTSYSTGPPDKEFVFGEQEEEGDDGRPTWDSKVKFVLACIGSCVGLGNFWRFPYLCYKSGGGAFMLPYITMLFLCGIPLLLMEMSIGQYTRLGPIGALNQLCPIFIGSAVGVVIISIIFCSYYNIIISWSIFYLTQSFRSVLPWTECPDGTPSNATDLGCVLPGNGSATQYYFDTQVLQKSGGIEDFGMPVLPLLGCVFAAWVIVYFSIWKSIKSSGAVVLVTATTPYLLILVFLIRAVTLEGAGDGMRFLFYPVWSQLLDIKVWVNAAAQNFNSIGIGFGSMITYSSYNKFSNNLLLDVWVIALVNACTSLLAGIIVFSTMGNIAFELGSNITDVVSEGPGLAFVVYPQALAKMPFPNFFSVLFFAMLIILGIDSQFATVEVIVTSLKDAFPKWIESKLGRHEVLALLVCLFCLVIGLPNIFQGGIYYFYLLDYYSAAISLMYLAFFEVAAVVWCYGAGTLCRNIREMTGRMPSNYFKWCWLVVSPALITMIAIASWLDYQEPTYNQGAYTYPGWAIGLGWVIACLSIVPIPIGVLIKLYLAPGNTLLEKLKYSVKPKIQSCPTCNRSPHNPEGSCRCSSHHAPPPPPPKIVSIDSMNKKPEAMLRGSIIPSQDSNAEVRGRTATRSENDFDSLDVEKGTRFVFS